MTQHIENWELPADPLAILKQNYPHVDWGNLQNQLILETAAGVSQQMFPEDGVDFNPLQAAYPQGTPEVLEELLKLELTGDILERAGKIVKLVEDIGLERMEQLQKQAANALERHLKKEAQKLEEATANGRGGESHGGNWMQGLEASNPRAPDKKVLEKIFKMKFLPQFQTSRSKKLLVDPDGEIHLDQPVEEVEDLLKMSWVDLASIPDEMFYTEFVSGHLSYECKYSFKLQGANIVLLIDDSGSMNTEEKISWVLGVLHLLAEKLRSSSGSIIYVGFFEESLSEFTELKTPNDVYRFIKHFHGGMGGETDIAHALRETSSRIKRGALSKANESTEIFVVNDGHDYINSSFTINSAVHILTLYQDNEDLALVALNNRGTAFKVNHSPSPEGYVETLEQY